MVGLDRIDVMASLWQPQRPERTRVGRLVEAAKDRGDDAAVALLANEAAEWSAGLTVDVDAVIVPVPPSPDRPNRLVPAVAAALGTALRLPVLDLIERHAVTPRLRDLEPRDRPAVAAAADYRFADSGTSETGIPESVVLVDDVVLTATTLEHLAAVLRRGGVRRVSAVAVARSRRR